MENNSLILNNGGNNKGKKNKHSDLEETLSSVNTNSIFQQTTQGNEDNKDNEPSFKAVPLQSTKENEAIASR